MLLLMGLPSAWSQDSADEQTLSPTQQAERLSSQGQPEEAAEAYTAIIHDNPHDVEALLSRAFIYNSLQLPALADEDYDLAVKAKPDSVDALLARSENHTKNHRFTESIRDDNRDLRLDPSRIYLYYWRARDYSELQQFEQSEADYTRIIESSAHLPDKDEEGTPIDRRMDRANYFSAGADVCRRIP